MSKFDTMDDYQIDHEIAKFIGFKSYIATETKLCLICTKNPENGEDLWKEFRPTTVWAQGGYLIEKYQVSLRVIKEENNPENIWCTAWGNTRAWADDPNYCYGKGHLSSAMRYILKKHCVVKEESSEICPLLM